MIATLRDADAMLNAGKDLATVMPPSNTMADFFMVPDGYAGGHEFLDHDPDSTRRPLVIKKKRHSFVLEGPVDHHPSLPDYHCERALAARPWKQGRMSLGHGTNMESDRWKRGVTLSRRAVAPAARLRQPDLGPAEFLNDLLRRELHPSWHLWPPVGCAPQRFPVSRWLRCRRAGCGSAK